MKETYFFSHDYHARNDRKMLKLKVHHKMTGLGVYWSIIEMLYEEGGKLLLGDIAIISDELRTDPEIVESVINDFELFENDNKYFWSESVIKRLDLRKEKSQKARESAKARWGDSDGKTRSERMSEARKTSGHSKEEWEELKSYFECCPRCDGESGLAHLEKDHVIPIYQGGDDSIQNIQPLCAKCNTSKSKEVIDWKLVYSKKKGIKLPAKFMRPHSETHAIKERKGNNKEIKKEKAIAFTPPIIEDVREYFKINGYTQSAAEKAFKYYESGGWKDSQGKQVKNWKQKMISVWFKDENKLSLITNKQSHTNYLPAN